MQLLHKEHDEGSSAHIMQPRAGLHSAESHVSTQQRAPAAPCEAGSSGSWQFLISSNLAAPPASVAAAAGLDIVGRRRLPTTMKVPNSYRRSLGVGHWSATVPAEPAQQSETHRRGLRQWGFANLGKQPLSSQPPPCKGACTVAVALGIVFACAVFATALCVCAYWRLKTHLCRHDQAALVSTAYRDSHEADRLTADAAAAAAKITERALLRPLPADDVSSGTVECPVCLDTMCDVMLPCGHGCCSSCVERIVAEQAWLAACPLCRQRIMKPYDAGAASAEASVEAVAGERL